MRISGKKTPRRRKQRLSDRERGNLRERKKSITKEQLTKLLRRLLTTLKSKFSHRLFVRSCSIVNSMRGLQSENHNFKFQILHVIFGGVNVYRINTKRRELSYLFWRIVVYIIYHHQLSIRVERVKRSIWRRQHFSYWLIWKGSSIELEAIPLNHKEHSRKFEHICPP